MTAVTVIVPAYNEGAVFGAALTSLSNYFTLHRAGGYEFRYIIVDDGSDDGETCAAISQFAHWRDDVQVFRHHKNRGLGRALKTVIPHVETEFALILDADLSYTPAIGMQLLERLDRDPADVVTASPYMRGGAVVNVPWARAVLSREANRILSLATCGRCTTLTCMVRAYRTDALKALEFRSDGMESQAEMLLCALSKDMRVLEVPATLQWSAERRKARGRVNLRRIASGIFKTLALAFSHRPALWLAAPGLFPGLLPMVIVLALLFHARPPVLATVTTATLVVQYGSLAIFAGQLGSFFTRTLHHSRRSKEANIHGL